MEKGGERRYHHLPPIPGSATGREHVGLYCALNLRLIAFLKVSKGFFLQSVYIYGLYGQRSMHWAACRFTSRFSQMLSALWVTDKCSHLFLTLLTVTINKQEAQLLQRDRATRSVG